MKNQNIYDERVLAQKRKTQSDAFSLLFFGLLLSVLIQQFIFHAPISQYVVELIMFISASVYMLVRSLMDGNDLFSSNISGHRIIIINSLVCGLTITIINLVLNYINLGDAFTTNLSNTILVSFMTFLCSTIIMFLLFQLLYFASLKRKKQIDNKFKDEDE